MRTKPIKVLLALLVALVIAGGSYWQIKFNKDWREQYAYVKGVEALIYAFPYQLNTALRYKWGQLDTPDGASGPVYAVNKFWHSPAADPKKYRDGGGPNLDTLYSPAWVYAKDQPVIIRVPEIIDDRYFSVQLAGFDSDNFSYISNRTHGNGGGNYAIVPPGWKGTLPNDVEFLVNNPTPWFLALARIYLDYNDSSDLERVKALQSQLQIVALSDWGKENPPRPPHPPIEDVGELSEMLLETDVVSYLKKMVIADPLSFWVNVNRAMTVNGVPAHDKRFLKDWATFHIGPDQDVYQADDNEQAGLARAVLDGMMILRDFTVPPESNVNGWGVPPHGMGRHGIHGNFYRRALLQSLMGIVSHDREEAIYMMARTDQYGDAFNSEHSYEIYFPAGHTPPVRYFWSLTVYDEDYNILLNPFDRYFINGNSSDLTYEADGGLRVLIGGTPPEGREGNWLPAGAHFLLRAYGPEKAMLERTWQPPPVKRL